MTFEITIRAFDQRMPKRSPNRNTVRANLPHFQVVIRAMMRDDHPQPRGAAASGVINTPAPIA